MTASYYDVVVLGADLGALATGALLTKRGFRVLIVGCQTPEPTYRVADMTLPRQPFAVPWLHSPFVRRVFAELSLQSLALRQAHVEDPMYQVVSGGQRLDVCADATLMEREAKREFGEDTRLIANAMAEIATLSDGFDRLLERHEFWPPPTYLTQRAANRALLRGGFDAEHLLGENFAGLSAPHPAYQAMMAPVIFSSDQPYAQLNRLCRARSFLGWKRGVAVFPDGFGWLRRQLIDKIIGANGEVRLRERIETLNVQGQRVVSVTCVGDEQLIGCGHVVTTLPLSRWAAWLPGASRSLVQSDGVRLPRRSHYRYTLNLVVRAACVPEAMARLAFFRPSAAEIDWLGNWLRIEAHPVDEKGRRVLSIQALLSSREVEESPALWTTIRPRLVAALQELLPFLPEELLYVDSPHDGLGVDDRREQRTCPAEEPWTRGPHTMEAVYHYPQHSYAGLCALPLQTSLKNVLLSNADVAPALGMEGRFLAASAVADALTRADQRRARMRKGQWTKVEL